MDSQHIFHILRRHATLNNVVLLVALVVVMASVWNTLSTLQKNYLLQQRVDQLSQEIEITRLEAENLKLQQNYYRSDEYLELTAKAKLGKALPGETVVILPPLPKTPVDEADTPTATPNQSNFAKWIQFFFGERSNPQD